MTRVPLNLSFLATLAALAACARSTPPTGDATLADAPSSFSLRLDLMPPAEGTAPEACPGLAGLVMAMATGGLQVPRSHRVDLRLQLACESSGRAVDVRAAATLTASRPGEPEEVFESQSSSQCPGCTAGRNRWNLLAVVARTLSSAMNGAATQFSLGNASDDAVVELLATPDRPAREVLLAALDVAGERRIKAAAAPVAGLLGSADPNVVLRAIGAAGRLADISLIRPLGRLALAPSPEIPHVALRAIADIGGPDASRTLEMVAASSTDPVIVREALDLMKELDQGREE